MRTLSLALGSILFILMGTAKAQFVDVSPCFSTNLQTKSVENADSRTKMAVADLVTKDNYNTWTTSGHAAVDVPFSWNANAGFESFNTARENYRNEHHFDLETSEVIGRARTFMTDAALQVIDTCVKGMLLTHDRLSYTYDTSDPSNVGISISWRPPQGAGGKPLKVVRSTLNVQPNYILPKNTVMVPNSVQPIHVKRQPKEWIHGDLNGDLDALAINIAPVPEVVVERKPPAHQKVNLVKPGQQITVATKDDVWSPIQTVEITPSVAGDSLVAAVSLSCVMTSIGPDPHIMGKLRLMRGETELASDYMFCNTCKGTPGVELTFHVLTIDKKLPAQAATYRLEADTRDGSRMVCAGPGTFEIFEIQP